MRISDWSSDVCSSDLAMTIDGRIRFNRRGILAAVLAGLAVTGCGKSADENRDMVVAATVDGQVEKPNVKLGFIKLTDMAPLAIAKEKGFFAEEGLNVTLEPQANWKVLLDGVIGGQQIGRAHV